MKNLNLTLGFQKFLIVILVAAVVTYVLHTLHKNNWYRPVRVVMVEGTWLERGYTFDPYKVKPVLENPNVCSKNSKIQLLIYIYSAVKNKEQRNAVRQNWGSPKFNVNKDFAFIFVLGRSYNRAMDESVALENHLYQDIVQFDYFDSYKNLTYKGLSVLKWMRDNFRNIQYFLKTDDDVVIVTDYINNELKKMKPFGFSSPLMLQCQTLQRLVKVIDHGKWSVSKMEYNAQFYPHYCSGIAFVMTYDVILQLYEASFHTPFMAIDDVFFSGFLPNIAGVAVTQMASCHDCLAHWRKC